MNLAYLVAGLIAVLGAAIHGGVGETVLVRKIDPMALPRTRLGGGRSALRLIRVSWHLVTITFAGFGATLFACSGANAGSACTGAGVVVAAVSTAFAAAIVATPILSGRPSGLIRHPAPLMLTSVAVLAWIGSTA